MESSSQGNFTQAEKDNPLVVGKTNLVSGSLKIGKTDRSAKPWSISEEVLSFIGIWENGVENGKNFNGQLVSNGFILTVYNDSRKLPTVGCGHLVTASDKLKLSDKITIEHAKNLLKADLDVAEKAVNEKVKVPLYQYEYDALVSITFNTGRSGALKLFEKVNKGDYEAVCEDIKKYRTGGGNKGRRASESNLFKSGGYDATH